MEKKTLTFRADNQILVGQNVPARFASDTVSYIEAVFDLGENWSGFDAVKAVWSTDFDSICTVLDSSWACVVPHEVLERVGDVWVNLVGSISENGSLTDRLTTYPIKAITVDANAAVCGSETAPITPSQFDQFAAAVRADADMAEAGATAAAASASSAAASATSASGSASSASQSASGAAQSAQSASESAESASESAQSASESAADAEEAKNTILNMTATATTLPEGSEATVDYSNGVMSFGIPRGDKGAKGDKGDTGETGATPNLSIGTVETLAPDEDATATITGTAENPVLNLGLPKGETGDVSKAELASLMPLETVSGSVASFSDGSAVFDAESALVTLEPIQSGSGTPSPDNVRPISGRTECVTSISPYEQTERYPITGRNLYNAPNNQGNILVPCHIPKGDKFVVSARGGNPAIRYYDADKVQIDYWTSFPNTASDGRKYRVITALSSKDVEYVEFYGAISDSTDFMVELGDTYTSYEPYGYSYTAQFPETVYGGTVDLVSGVLTVERAMVDLGTLNWIPVNNSETARNEGLFVAQSISGISNFPSYSAVANLVSSKYAVYPAYNYLNTGRNPSIGISQYDNYVYVFDTEFANKTNAEVKSAMDGVQLVYELATPQTYQLTPQAIALLTGDNNVWSDGGSIEVKYRANIGLYVDKKISEVSQ